MVCHCDEAMKPLSLTPPFPLPPGLFLKLREQDAPFVYFTYSLPPMMETAVPVDWKVLVTENVESQHIRCHELQPTDQLSSLIPEFQKAYAMAIVLINVDDTYILPEACLKGVEEPPIPVVILTHTDGQSLLKQLDYYEGKDVLTRLDAESQVDLPGQQMGRETASPQRQGIRPPIPMSPEAAQKEPGNHCDLMYREPVFIRIVLFWLVT